MKIWLLIVVLCLCSCGTTKAYLGPTLPDENVVIIYQPDNKMFSMKMPAAYIGNANGVEVGSFLKGYPSHVKVLPGYVELTLNLTWPALSQGMAVGTDGIRGPANVMRSKMYSGEVEKGKTYKVIFDLVDGKQDIVIDLDEYTAKSR